MLVAVTHSEQQIGWSIMAYTRVARQKADKKEATISILMLYCFHAENKRSKISIELIQKGKKLVKPWSNSTVAKLKQNLVKRSFLVEPEFAFFIVQQISIN